MTHETLNNSMLLHLHKAKMDELDLRNVAEVSHRSNDTRMNFSHPSFSSVLNCTNYESSDNNMQLLAHETLKRFI